MECSPLYTHVPFLPFICEPFLPSSHITLHVLMSCSICLPSVSYFFSSMVFCFQIICIFLLLHFTPPCSFILLSIMYFSYSCYCNSLHPSPRSCSLSHTPHLSTSQPFTFTTATRFLPPHVPLFHPQCG